MKYKFVFIFICNVQALFAQDLHWSQGLRQPMWLNPAQIGTMPEDGRFSAAYRQQWQSVPVPFLSVMAAYDSRAPKLLPTRLGALGLGALVGYDRAGDAGLQWSVIGLGASFSRVFGQTNQLSLGLMWSGMQRAVRPNKLSFGSQYNGAQFDPNATNNEVFEALSATASSFSVGFEYQGAAATQRVGWQLGTAMYHLNVPTYHFTSLLQQAEPEVLPRVSAHGLLWFKPSERLTYFGWMIGQNQGKYNEIIGGIAAKYNLVNTLQRRIYLQTSLATRYSDALISGIEIGINDWSIGISYDINTSLLRAATQRRGGPEVTLLYTITKPKPPKVFKACPIF